MGIKKAAWLFITGVSAILIFSGCINFYVKDSNLPTINEWPLKSEKSQIIGLTISTDFHTVPPHPPRKSLWWINESINNEKDLLKVGFLLAFKAFDDSNLFKETQVGSNNSDYVANIHITWSEESSVPWGLPHAMTLGVLPVKNSRRMQVQVSILDAKGNILGEYENGNRVIAWRGLLLLPFSPLWIWWDDRPAEYALFEIFRQIIIDAHEQGIF